MGKNRSRLALGLLVLTVVFGSLAATRFGRSHEREGRRIFRYQIQIPVRNMTEGRRFLAWLSRSRFDIAGVSWRDGQVEVITDESGVARLQKAGLKGRFVQTQIPGVGVAAIDPNYLNPEKVEKSLLELSRQFPGLTRLEKIGTSFEGRPILALLISSTPQNGNPQLLEKPSMIFDGMHHAREVMTSEIVMDVARSLLGAAASGSEAAMKVLDRWNIWVVPMLNVDGNNRVWTADAWWRKNTRAAQSDIYGVDLNRNYPYRWADCNGSSGYKYSEDFHGDVAASEPETQALVRLAQAVRPTAYLSYHSYGEMLLYPLTCSQELAGENALLEKIADEMASILPGENGGHYTTGTPWQILYPVDGDSMSFMHAEFGALAFTLEVNREFQPPYSMRQPTLVTHRKAWQYLLERMDRNLLTIQVIDGRTGKPALARVEFSSIPHRYGEKMFQTNDAGYFFKVLDPGPYEMRVTLMDGRRLETRVEMRGASQRLPVTVP